MQTAGVQPFDNALLEQHLALAARTLPGPDYYAVLQWIHQALKPETYIEIGIRQGASLRMALPQTKCIGIDPEPMVPRPYPPNTSVFAMTSDDFFTREPVSEILGAQGFRLAFIDGLHLFEQVLRDFINLEKFAAQGSIIMLHDCLPLDGPTADRTRTTHFYSGDIWKAVMCLRVERPDLMMKMIRTGPTGLCLVGRLDNRSDTLAANYDKVVANYMKLGYDDYLRRIHEMPDAVANTPEAVAACVAGFVA